MSSQPQPQSHNESHRVASSDAGTDDRTLYDHTSDDEAYDGRPSGDLDERDRDILDSEDERERLLTREDGGKGILGRKGSGVKVGKWDKKSETKGRRKSGNEEASALMYEMEEGIGASSTSFRSRRSSQSDEQRLLASELQRKVCEVCECADEKANTCYRHAGKACADAWLSTYPSSFSSSSSSQLRTISPPQKTSRAQ